MIDLLIGFATSALGIGLTGGAGIAAMVASAFMKRGALLAKWGGRLAIVACAFFYGYHLADNRAEMQSRIATLEQDIANKERDLENERVRSTDVRRERDRLRTTTSEMNEKVADYEEKLSKRPPSAACTIDDADLRLLKRLRQPGGKTQR